MCTTSVQCQHRLYDVYSINSRCAPGPKKCCNLCDRKCRNVCNGLAEKKLNEPVGYIELADSDDMSIISGTTNDSA